MNMRMGKQVFWGMLLGMLMFSSCKEVSYKDAGLSAEVRADLLAQELTLDEKESLMMNKSAAVPRLGIRSYDWWNEALHGVARNGTATVFPQAIGMAASFNDVLLKRVFDVVSDEARVKHRQARDLGDMKRYAGLTMWTPNINIFRDPRWGRGQETYGEDPYLTGIMGVAVIKGLQGDRTDGIDKLHACAKHYAVHSGPEGNRHSFDAKNIAPRDLWETYLPAFKVAVQKGDVREVMCAYNRFEGKPCCGSDQLLSRILRDQWGYQGVVVSDCGAIDDFYEAGAHMTHADAAHATAAAIINGTDLECGRAYAALTDAVDQGLVSEVEVDVPLKRLLTARFELGEMDATSPWDTLEDSLVNCGAHVGLSLQMAKETIVLLKNNGVLPLSAGAKIAVLGPNAADAKMQWGNYNGEPKHTITLLEALRNRYPNSELVYDEACNHTGYTEGLFGECANDGVVGVKATYWSNTGMEGAAAAELVYENMVRIGKRDTIAEGLPLLGISAKYVASFVPTVTGPVEFVFTTKDTVKLLVDGKGLELTKKIPALQFAVFNVKAGQRYSVVADIVHQEKGGIRFEMLRRVAPDLDRIKSLVKDVDVVVFAGGLSASYEREEANVYAPGFVGGDRDEIELPQVQRDVIAALKSTGKKLVMVNYSGSAVGLEPESQICDALLQAWYPGEAGGTAVADILYGDYNPAGRLPVTFYKNIEQLPHFEDYSMKGHTYRFMEEAPLYPFGYGLSYTTFAYNSASLGAAEIAADGKLVVNVSVSNTGDYAGDEVVQLYLKKRNDVGGPNKTLRAFRRVNIAKGQTKELVFELAGDQLEWWDPSTQTMRVHAGDYTLMYGGSSREQDLKTVDFSVK